MKTKNKNIVLSLVVILTLTDLYAGSVLSGTGSAAIGNKAVVAGGLNNSANGYMSTIAGGREHVANGNYATVGGGFINKADGYMALVAGGRENEASGDYATVSGGFRNISEGYMSLISGGRENNAIGNYATILGGNSNSVSGNSLVVGGTDNQIQSYPFNGDSGPSNTIGGGRGNWIEGRYIQGNTIAGGIYNWIRNDHTNLSTISGGINNRITGEDATIAGGRENKANGTGAFAVGTACEALGDYSVAVGRKAFAENNSSVAIGNYVKSQHRGAWVIGDSMTHINFRLSQAKDKFHAYFSNGYNLYTTKSSEVASGAYMNAGDSAWNALSDKTKKENYKKVNKQEILNKLIAMPIEEWNYLAQKDNIRHIGPYAQDFNKAYGLGDGKLSISTIDADGVALVAVQALAERNKILETKVNTLERRLQKLELLLK